MKKLIILGILLLLTSISISSDEPPDTKIARLEKIIEDQNQTVRRAEKMVNNLKKQLAEKEKENKRLLALCRKAGIDTNKPGLQDDPNTDNRDVQTKHIENSSGKPDITLQKLNELFGAESSLTNLQQQELCEKYTNKIIRLTGKLESVYYEEVSDTIETSFIQEQENTYVTVTFPGFYKNRFLKLKKHSIITYEARLPKDCNSILIGNLSLTDGRIVE